jgi:pantoate--beta-alanine ligase
MTRVVHTVAELRAAVAELRRGGRRIGFVPTMGNLHAGHLRLVEVARTRADAVVASVFVNPLQFGPTEDFERYPRTLAQDRAKLESAGCDLLFAPSAEEMYPRGRQDLTTVAVPELSGILCGRYRPGHFDGVTTVVNILFNQVQPDVALFGDKDYQQLFLIRRMVADLHLPVEIVGVPTEREADGLALSSRNQYLSAEERTRAAAIHRALEAVADGLHRGRRDYAALAGEQLKVLESQGFKPQYLEIRRPDLGPPDAQARAWVILVAAYLGSTRLIDNRSVAVQVV